MVGLPAGCAGDGQLPPNQNFYTAAARTYGFQQPWSDRGARASVEDHVYGGGVQCKHVASVQVLAQNGDWAEVGWITAQSGYGVCTPFTGETNMPKAFYVYVIAGVATCKFRTDVTVSGGDNPTASVRSNISGNPNNWIYDFNNGSGNSFTLTVTGLHFTAGVSTTDTDRITPPETANGHFIGMQYRTANDTWTAWGSEICANGQNGTPDLSNDPDYNNQLTQTNEVTVSTNPADCN